MEKIIIIFGEIFQYGENNYNFWRNIPINRNWEGKNKNNVVNYITRDDLFFENI